MRFKDRYGCSRTSTIEQQGYHWQEGSAGARQRRGEETDTWLQGLGEVHVAWSPSRCFSPGPRAKFPGPHQPLPSPSISVARQPSLHTFCPLCGFAFVFVLFYTKTPHLQALSPSPRFALQNWGWEPRSVLERIGLMVIVPIKEQRTLGLSDSEQNNGATQLLLGVRIGSRKRT